MSAPKKDWADEKPSSDSDDSIDEKEEKKEPSANQEKHETHFSHSRGRRGDRRRNGRGGRNKYDGERPRPKTLHPSHYTDVINKADPPYELKLIVDQNIKPEEMIKHFTTVFM